jgi:hypothetical protein
MANKVILFVIMVVCRVEVKFDSVGFFKLLGVFAIECSKEVGAWAI